MKRSLLVFVLLFVMLAALTACGGSEATTNIKLDMVEFTFTPAEFTVPAGREVTITVANNGAVLHEFVIFNLGMDAGGKFGDEDEANIYWEVEVLPGETTTTTFVAPSEPGEYYVTCGIEGHLEAGMSGKLFVVEK